MKRGTALALRRQATRNRWARALKAIAKEVNDSGARLHCGAQDPEWQARALFFFITSKVADLIAGPLDEYDFETLRRAVRVLDQRALERRRAESAVAS